jgi:hypothetical protein
LLYHPLASKPKFKNKNKMGESMEPLIFPEIKVNHGKYVVEVAARPHYIRSYSIRDDHVIGT